MKPNQHPVTRGIFLKQTLQTLQSFSLTLRLLLAALVFCAMSASAVNLTWDAGNLTDGTIIDSASGAWNIDTATNFDWNNGTNNVSWSQTSISSPLNGAIFTGPDATNGAYQVVVDQGQVSATNLTINANGYVFSGSPIYLSGNSSTRNFIIADGKTVVISNNVTGTSTCEYLLGSSGAPASVTIFGNVTGFTPTFTSTNGSILYLAGTNSASIGNILADVRLTNGTYNSSSAFVIGRNGGSLTQPSNATGSFTVDGPATILNQTSDYIYLGRVQGNGNTPWNATLTIQNGATVNYQPGIDNNNLGLALPRVGSSGANCKSQVYMNGGTLNMGPGTESPQVARPIFLANGGSLVGQSCILVQSGGVINAWSGIQIGGGGTYSGGTAAYTNSGGFLYLGSIGGGGGIRLGASFPPTNRVSLSGGTLGALQSWISSVPMFLDGNNGNITFQSADANGNPFNIALSGAVTGPGGLNKTGGGVLTLSGTNNYSGSTTVSNGTLVVPNLASPVNGDVLVDGGAVSAGLPIVSNIISVAGQSWTSGNLSFTSGQPTLSFNFGGLPPSPTVAPIQLTGNLAFTVTPLVLVDGSALSVGDYPLIHYTGSLSGTAPTAPAVPVNVVATITNNTATHTLVLHVTSGPVSSLAWAIGNGTWDIGTSLDWKQNGLATTYHDGNSVQFDNTSSGTSPINITLNTTVNPANIAVTGTKSYIISGPIPGAGDINGPIAVNVSGGTLTLSNANTYTGGTTVGAPGQLNINYGGTGGSDSAIGTGPLNLNTGAKIDNTSGHALVLNTATPIPISWNDDWTFVGTTNLDLGLGQVTLGNVEVVLTVVSNALTVNNQITDNGLAYKLTKQGNGALTLSNVNNSFSGGLDFENGTLNFNADSAGQGTLNIGGGVLDNTSGADVTLNSISKLDLLANFTFNGTGNLNLGFAPTTIGGGPQIITLNGTGTLETDGTFLGGNRSTTVTGTGQWIIGGSQNNSGLGLNINGGTVYFAKSGGNAIGGGNSIAVNTNGTLVMLSATGTQIGTTTQVTLGGGTMDLDGDSETVSSLAFNSGILKNSADNTTSSLTITNTFILSGNCTFEVDGTNGGFLDIPSIISGTGSLIKTGLGTLALSSNSIYTGNTTISNGTVALQGASYLASPVIILAAANAILDVSDIIDTNGNSTAEITLAVNQTLSGIGGINGGLIAPVGSTVMPGTPASVGTLTVTNDVTLSGNLLVGLNRPGSSSRLVSATGTITYGGTLSLTNIGPTLHVGDTFQLFPSAVTAFTGINLPTTDASGFLYTWQNNVANDGSVKVLTVTSPVSTNPTNIVFTLTGNSLALSWPTNYLGWRLQAQTNAPGAGVQTNWFTVAGSTNVTSTNFTLNPANGSVFYRMVYP